MLSKSFKEIEAIAKAEGLITPEYEEYIRQERIDAAKILLEGFAEEEPESLSKVFQASPQNSVRNCLNCC